MSPLNRAEAAHLARSDDYERKAKEGFGWLDYGNFRLLALAVNDRKQFVDFDDGTRFSIRYDDKLKNVFVRPLEFNLPCGYFSYDQLKAELND